MTFTHNPTVAQVRVVADQLDRFARREQRYCDRVLAGEDKSAWPTAFVVTYRREVSRLFTVVRHLRRGQLAPARALAATLHDELLALMPGRAYSTLLARQQPEATL